MIKETNSPGESSTTRFSNRKRLTWACRSSAYVRRKGERQGWTVDGRTQSRKKQGKRERKAAEMRFQERTFKIPVWRVPGLPRTPWTNSRKKKGRSSGTTVLLAEREEKNDREGSSRSYHCPDFSASYSIYARPQPPPYIPLFPPALTPRTKSR